MTVTESTWRMVAFLLGLGLCALIVVNQTEARGRGDASPAVVEREMPHAWCYVMLNDNNAVGDINMLSCVPKE